MVRTTIKLLITLLIAFVPLANAGVGDVYYCVMESAGVIESPSGHRPLKLDKFTMKWQESEIEIRASGFEFTNDIVVSERESFTAVSYLPDRIDYWSFKDGRLQDVSAHNGLKSTIIVSTATCDKFD
jgi:hypothetical protein